MLSPLENRHNVLIILSEKMILLYRRLASERIRKSCRFEPSCSEYTLLSLRENGFLAGWQKALRRVIRCRPPHGGIEMP